ncbi:MAG: peptidylprolyl isomerase [Gemmatimonadales bacterium]
MGKIVTLHVGIGSLLSLGALVVAFGGGVPAYREGSAADLDSVTWMELLAAEDSRAATAEQLQALVRGTKSKEPVVRRIAVRALGRLERPDVVSYILPLLTDPVDTVRAEAANALGQAVYRGDAGRVTGPLLGRLDEEHDPWVRGAVAETLGRLPYVSVDTVRAISAAIVNASESLPAAAAVGFAHGLESLVRKSGSKGAVSTQVTARLHELAGYESDGTHTAVLVRRSAVAALVESGRVDSAVLARWLQDQDDQVRQLVMRAERDPATASGIGGLIARGLDDRAPLVRYAALRAYARGNRNGGCGWVLRAVDDSDVHVALLAVDLLGVVCRGDSVAVAVLKSLITPIITGRIRQDSWHRGAHALVALATLDPQRSNQLIEQASRSELYWVRLYAVRAATAAHATDLLKRLASDPSDNVREAAVSGLRAEFDHGADTIYAAQLDRSGYQLLIAVAKALEGSPLGREAVPPLIESLGRVSAERRQTSRDARSALLERVGELGNADFVESVRPYLIDFDPVIATQAAAILTRWTGTNHAATPVLLAPQPLPALGEIRELATSRPVLVMRGGGEIVLRLLPYEAPTNSARFARLAREGYFDGLSFHRVVPGFVIQGGSPGANEFVGDGPYTRDELTMRSHVRGTVGVSTRGRDTGDGQIFVNLVDNRRLDHNYTIFAEVVEGMDAVEDIVEGSVIERIVWR